MHSADDGAAALGDLTDDAHDSQCSAGIKSTGGDTNKAQKQSVVGRNCDGFLILQASAVCSDEVGSSRKRIDGFAASSTPMVTRLSSPGDRPTMFSSPIRRFCSWVSSRSARI